MRQYMSRVDSIVKAGKVSPRIKYLLLDILELRNVCSCLYVCVVLHLLFS